MRTCAAAGEALRLLDEWRPDVLVSDIGMPGEDGYELMRKVRARKPERGGQVPAVALTGWPDPSMRGGCVRLAIRCTSRN